MAVQSPPRWKVASRFKIIEPVGRGGFATVWRGVDVETDQPVAVKFPRLGRHSEQELSRRFRQEAAIGSLLGQAALPTVIARCLGTDLDLPETDADTPQYIVTEFVEGMDLPDSHASGALPEGIAAIKALGVPVARGIEYLHANGISYLDCRPENIRCRPDGDPVMIDFNTAVRTTDTDATRFHDDGYKAPEQTPTDRPTADAHSGPWSDVYSLGILFVSLLTGKPPAERPADGIDPELLSAHGCPVALGRVIQQSTRVMPARRYPDAGGFLTAVYAALGRPDAAATLTETNTGLCCPIRHTDSVGRRTAAVRPTIDIVDPLSYISPRQCVFTVVDGQWHCTDTSVNGTYIGSGDDWHCIHERARGRQTAATALLETPTQISPVTPEYPISFRFDPAPPDSTR